MPSNQKATSSSNDEGLAALVRRIKIGDQAARGEFHSVFATGIECLLRLKLGKTDVSTEVAAVIEATVQTLQTARPSESPNLPGLIVTAIHAQFPSSVPSIESASRDSSADKTAQSILAEMSPLEQDILRQYYALEATPSAIQSRLRVGSQTITETLAKARSMFFRRAAGS